MRVLRPSDARGRAEFRMDGPDRYRSRRRACACSNPTDPPDGRMLWTNLNPGDRLHTMGESPGKSRVMPRRLIVQALLLRPRFLELPRDQRFQVVVEHRD